jgi:uncharacterized membrane protein
MKLSALPAILLLWFLYYREVHIDEHILLLTFIIGIIATISGFLYLKVFEHGDASTVMPMYELSPLWSLFLSFLIL